MGNPGRPPIYTPELAAEVCRRLSEGETLRAICRDDAMPSRPTITGWIIHDIGGFAAQYAHARDVGLDVLAEQLMQIADTPQEGSKIEEGPTGKKIITGDMIEHRRLQVDARKWYLAKLAPKRYGEAQRMELTGDPAAPLRHQVEVVFVPSPPAPKP